MKKIKKKLKRKKKKKKKKPKGEEIETKNSTKKTQKELNIVHTRTLTVSDDILCIKHSKDGKFIAMGLQDATIRVFYEDSFKFVFSLYGHKLPVLGIDISSDNRFLISASSDKNVKLWGLDFGNCVKSFFAHNDAVTNVVFVPQTHYFFFCWSR